MEATELMIGDWVFNKHHKKYIQITPYDFFNHAHLPSGEKYFVSELKVISGRDFEPISLTAEILEKNGFYWGYTSSEEYSISNMPEDIPIPLIMPDKHWCYDNEDGGEVTIELPNESDGGFVTVSNNDRSIEFIFDKSICLHELQHLLRLCGLSDLADNIKMEE